MKRNRYICVKTSVNENPANNFNEFAQSIHRPDNFEKAWEDFKRQIVSARTKNF